jgi:hypothetical protein
MARLTASAALEESVSANRNAKVIPELTKFLRAEYFRRNGVYINKATNEFSRLMQFWKDNVSEVYRKKREEKLAMRQSGNEFNISASSIRNA